MRKVVVTIVILLAVILNSNGQSEAYGLRDDLLTDKQVLMAKYLPMHEGQYLHAFYVIPPDEMLERLDRLRQELLQRGAAIGPDEETARLQSRDAEFTIRNILQWYTSLYGMDSVGMKNFEKVVTESRNAPDFNEQLIEAQKKAFPLQLDSAQRARLTGIFASPTDLDDAVLFKRSAAYRKWLGDYLDRVIHSKYPLDPVLGYEGRHLSRLKAIEGEIDNPVIKEFYIFETTGTILKSMKDVDAKEKAYQDFMSVVSNPVYRKELETIYENFKNMTSNALAPDFTYPDVDGKPVSLRDLRGKYVYIDVWATWCAPCKAEIPFLSKLEKDYHGKNIHFVSLSVDRARDKSKWIDYVKENALGGIQIMADNDFSSDFIMKFNVNSIPRFILIDPEGRIVSGDAKRPSDPELREELDALLL